MSIRTYRTDETCPVCGVNILEGLRQHVYEEGGRDFEYECPSCEHMMYIEVEPVPAFSISTVESSPTPREADIERLRRLGNSVSSNPVIHTDCD